MKNIKIQTEHGTCGIFNLANALRDENILLFANNEDYIPCGISESNKILKELEMDISLWPIITTFNWQAEIPSDFLTETILSLIKQNPSDDKINCVNIFILVVQIGFSAESLHAVTLIHHNNIFAYSDPMNEGFEILESLDGLFEKSIYVSSIESFVNSDGYVIWDGDKLNVMELFN